MARMASIEDTLPAELIDAIIEQCIDHAPITSTLSSISVVSSRFRSAVQTILFSSIAINLENSQRRGGETLLEFLLRMPHIRRCVRTVRLYGIDRRIIEEGVEYSQLGHLLPLLGSLQRIEINCGIQPVWDTLSLIGSLERRPAVVIWGLKLGRYIDVEFHNAIRSLRSISNVKSLDLNVGTGAAPIFVWKDQYFTTPEDVRAILAACPSLEYLRLTFDFCKLNSGMTEDSTRPKDRHDSDDSSYLVRLRELSLGEGMGFYLPHLDIYTDWMALFEWSSIEKLNISGSRLATFIFPRFGRQMVNLRNLQFVPYPRVKLDPSDESKKIVLLMSSFLETKSMVELELDGCSKDLTMRLLASVKLRKLRLHSSHARGGFARANLRSVEEFRELAELAPNLEELILDTSHGRHLWHPTATSGVSDDDSRLDQILDSLSSFSRLKVVHLIPLPNTSNLREEDHWSEAKELSGQVVQLFKHIRAIQPSIELLVISTEDSIGQWLNIVPSSWTVCRVGDRVLVRFRKGMEGKTKYEQRQIWHGQRQLWAEIKRYSYDRHYLDGDASGLRF